MSKSTSRNGDRGVKVRELQQLLNAKLELGKNLIVDGVFGDRTAQAVREFQAVSGSERPLRVFLIFGKLDKDSSVQPYF